MKYEDPKVKFKYHYKALDCFSGEYGVLHTNKQYSLHQCIKGYEIIEDISRYCK